jgi:DNA-binding NarL/FixJ family response regulator
MVGPIPAGRKWTSAEENQLLDLVAAGVKAPAIARRLGRSVGATYARINGLKKSLGRVSRPSERLVAAHASAAKDQLKS